MAEVENSKLIIYLRALMIVLGYGLRITTQYMGHVLPSEGRVMHQYARLGGRGAGERALQFLVSHRAGL